MFFTSQLKAMQVIAMFVALSFPLLVAAGNSYTLLTDFTVSPASFFDGFNFFTDADPTHGFVKYVDATTAAASKLIGYTPANHIYFGVDSTTASTPSGRPSVRMTSNATYSPGTLMIADIAHMPTGCGVWGSWWTVGLGAEWPKYGEADIIENVNEATTNAMTLHTDAGCVVDNSTSSAPFDGILQTSNCDINAAGQSKNEGCSVAAPASSASFGASFNSNGGGVYAFSWLEQSMSVWFFPKSATQPASLLTDSPDVSTFGTPMAHFSGSGCDFSAHFKNMSIVFDTTLCGDWAGEVWQSGGCAAKTGVDTCQAFVQANPANFTEAYWEIRSLKVYSATFANSTVPAAATSTVSLAASATGPLAYLNGSAVVIARDVVNSSGTTGSRQPLAKHGAGRGGAGRSPPRVIVYVSEAPATETLGIVCLVLIIFTVCLAVLMS